MPPAKRPMLTLLKQARAYGLGILLATQNPVDLDYKGLANTGTWLIGRLQTERDKARLLDGLEGVAASSEAGFDRGAMDKVLSSLDKRVFLMHNVHEPEPVVLHSRWALSYLRGPLTQAQIRTLTPRDEELAPQPSEPVRSQPPTPVPAAPVASAPLPVPPPPGPVAETHLVPPDVLQYHLPASIPSTAAAELVYRPAVLGAARLHYIRKTADIDLWRDLVLAAHVSEEESLAWGEGYDLTRSLGLLRSGLPPDPTACEAIGAELAKMPEGERKQALLQRLAQIRETGDRDLYI